MSRALVAIGRLALALVHLLHGRAVMALRFPWLDIAAIHAVAPQARFVSKADVGRWPLLGRLVAGAGTLFIERESKRDALRVVHQAAAALHAGDMVAVFPEGTTGPGRALLPFHANLLQAAIATASPVQPVVLRFHQPGQAFSVAAEFVGDTTLLQSVWRIVCAQGLQVEVQWLDAERTAHADRRALAAHLRERIDEALARAA
ncbi:MAG: lysophospholipid acyltransferase family protein [Burkholderiaceae bacterium]|nr:lysophospholipid acyltransferase family protein [Burkholderiaceae bacterium]